MLPTFIITWAVITAVVGTTAWLCSRRRRRYATYALMIVLYTVAAFRFLDSDWHAGSRSIEADALTFAPWTIVYLLIPGLMVRKESSLESIFEATALVTLLALPAWFVYGVFVCYMGQDCILD